MFPRFEEQILNICIFNWAYFFLLTFFTTEWQWINRKRVGNYYKSINTSVQDSSVTQSCPTLCHPMNHSTPGLCPSLTPRVHSDSHPSSSWCQPAISSSVVPFSSCPQSLPASECFPMSQLFAWDGQSTGVSALTSFLPKNTQDWSSLEWTGWISLQSMGLSRVFSNTTVQKHQFYVLL